MTKSHPLIEQADWLNAATPPTMYDLPSEDPEESGLPDEFHDLQPQLLSATLRLTDVSQDRLFTGTDLNLYYIGNWLPTPLEQSEAKVARLAERLRALGIDPDEE